MPDYNAADDGLKSWQLAIEYLRKEHESRVLSQGARRRHGPLLPGENRCDATAPANRQAELHRPPQTDREKERGADSGEPRAPVWNETGRVDGQTDNARTILKEAVRGA